MSALTSVTMTPSPLLLWARCLCSLALSWDAPLGVAARVRWGPIEAALLLLEV